MSVVCQKPDCAGIDFFAGIANIQKSLSAAGLRCLAYDKVYNPIGHDILHPRGFLTALVWTLRLAPYSFTHWGTCCSTW
eukprot:1731174-Alexandrium_andersonii.AAC.1